MSLICAPRRTGRTVELDVPGGKVVRIYDELRIVAVADHVNDHVDAEA